MEGIIVISGMCLTFVPIIFFVKYLMVHISKDTPFDSHLRLVKDKKGNFGVIIAYLEKLFLGLFICSLGIFMSSYFENMLFLEIFVISLILFIVVNYIDNNNEK